MKFVVTGGAGFFGSILRDYLVEQGHQVLSIDLLPHGGEGARYKALQLDITDREKLLEALSAFKSQPGAVFDRERQAAAHSSGQSEVEEAPIDCIFHVAALLAHVKEHRDRLWAANVEGTRNVMESARALSVKKVVFTSTNCVFSSGCDRPVDESQPVQPIEVYGKSKLAAEEIINSYKDVPSVIIRCPTITAAGRLGLLTILFDFVREGRRLYLVGDGSNRYSFIAADDLANACLLAATCDCSGLYHIGSDNVPTMRELYGDLQANAGQKRRLVSIPEGPTVIALKILNTLGLSPLGPYHYRMLAANFVFDASKFKRDTGWKPTRTNTEILIDAYNYYTSHLSEIMNPEGRSAHQQRAKAGILNLLRLIS